MENEVHNQWIEKSNCKITCESLLITVSNLLLNHIRRVVLQKYVDPVALLLPAETYVYVAGNFRV